MKPKKFYGQDEGNVFYLDVKSDTMCVHDGKKVISSSNGKNISAIKIEAMLRRVFQQYGRPKTIVVDNGREWCADGLREFLDRENISIAEKQPYSPRTSPIERHMRRQKGVKERVVLVGPRFEY